MEARNGFINIEKKIEIIIKDWMPGTKKLHAKAWRYEKYYMVLFIFSERKGNNDEPKEYFKILRNARLK